MHKKRSAQLAAIITYALRDCCAKHPEWFATGNLTAIERQVHTTLTPFLNSTLQLSYDDGLLACMHRMTQRPSA